MCHAEGSNTTTTRATVVFKIKMAKGFTLDLRSLVYAWYSELSVELLPLAEVLLKHTLHRGPQTLEINMAELTHEKPALGEISPRVYFTEKDETRDIFLIAMEYLAKDMFTHTTFTDRDNPIDQWDSDSIRYVLKDIAHFHGSFMESFEDILGKIPEISYFDQTSEPSYHELHLKHLNYDTRDFPAVYTPERVAVLKRVFSSITTIVTVINKAKKTLCHNDFCYRNLCLRRQPKDGERHLCVYDWETAQIDVPQSDLVRFHAYILPRNGYIEEVAQYNEFYRKNLYTALCGKSEELAREVTEPGYFNEVYDMCVFLFSYRWLPLFAIAARHPMPSFTREMFDNLASNILTYVFSAAKKYDFLK